MNVNNLIIDTLSDIGCPVAKMRYNLKADTYIVFAEYNQASKMNADDFEQITQRFYQVDIFSKTDFTYLVNNVRKKLKKAGFGRMFESETYDEDMQMYRSIMRFNFETKIEEE